MRFCDGVFIVFPFFFLVVIGTHTGLLNFLLHNIFLFKSSLFFFFFLLITNKVVPNSDFAKNLIKIKTSLYPISLYVNVNKVLLSFNIFQRINSQNAFNLSRPCISEICSKLKINLNFYFRFYLTDLWGLKRFYKKSVKIKI